MAGAYLATDYDWPGYSFLKRATFHAITALGLRANPIENTSSCSRFVFLWQPLLRNKYKPPLPTILQLLCMSVAVITWRLLRHWLATVEYRESFPSNVRLWWLKKSSSQPTCDYNKVKVKLFLCLTNQALHHESVWGSGCIDPHFLYLSTSWRWAVSFTPLPPYPRGKSPSTNWTGEWVGSRAGLDVVEQRKFLNLPGLELRPLGRPAHSQSLYRLRYPGSCDKIHVSKVK
jgi:hypothetical protein